MRTSSNNQTSSYLLVSWLFLRGLALFYFAAFASMLVQIEGLIGSQGILPVRDWLSTIMLQEHGIPLFRVPTLFWFNASDTALMVSCGLGLLAAVALLLNILPRTALLLCYGLYLSLVQVGQVFTSFQWDAFLLETGFLAIFLTWGAKPTVFMFRWLLARFMFMGGVVKIASGDPNWANLTALNYHYQTQPLPSPLAYYAHFLPSEFQQFCVTVVLLIELVIPVLVFLPRRFRLVAAWCFIALQIGIILTGNYTFFNLLTLWLCLFLFDDRDLQRWLPFKLARKISAQPLYPGSVAYFCAVFWFGVILSINALSIWSANGQHSLAPPLKSLLRLVDAFSLINNYGPFAVMTTTRPEIIIQGSNDGSTWLDYRFKFKPDELSKGLTWNIPHQPRLDWQLWFAALKAPDVEHWLAMLMDRLLEGSKPVSQLFAENPFLDQPPLYVRALLYEYSYNPPELRASSGQLWRRKYLGELIPQTKLSR